MPYMAIKIYGKFEYSFYIAHLPFFWRISLNIPEKFLTPSFPFSKMKVC